nr:hypothetical protein TIFTF001_049378 [Ficus carica]
MWRDLSGARQVTRTIGGLQDETTNPAVGDRLELTRWLCWVGPAPSGGYQQLFMLGEISRTSVACGYACVA